ncbi:Ortho-halobenzoate 1,2-dioxygenase alpha-ISP protein OhbB [Caballeronia sordidicola]|uniref:Ortho-halobenzoate 1,2-dioxygenase alpha-ISP protein OhbB n=1 Tax=Caballeronia sordidicola TaxID=196367 RepID=A0A242MAC3_CABSO|nr:Ortho-halobenzoate 1,2-dioxygenase alpha-ISP protein OhbB [Caballeronia sordidicola]
MDSADGDGVAFPHDDGSRVPFKVFSSQAVYNREQERIYRGPTWNFVALEAESLKPGDFKSTFVGDTPVVVTRSDDWMLAAWVNRCAHRGASVCRKSRGNASSHTCVYYQWSFDKSGNLLGVPIRRGQKGMAGMPANFDPKNHSLRKSRVESYRGLVFATFSETLEPLPEDLGSPCSWMAPSRRMEEAQWLSPTVADRKSDVPV